MFDVAATAYNRFMGPYATTLAELFVGLIDVRPGQTVLDVGCGPGALTAALVRRLGSEAVAAVDPSESFVAAVRDRLAGVDVRHAPAEQLPFADGTFDASTAQLVVHFMADPTVGLAEMARVTRAGGTVAACVWDFAGERAPVSLFWRAARAVTPEVPDESNLAGAREGELAALFTGCGLRSVQQSVLEVAVDWPSFDDWWEPFTLGVGPAGAHLSRLGTKERARVRSHAERLLPTAPFTIRAVAWAATGQAA